MKYAFILMEGETGAGTQYHQPILLLKWHCDTFWSF